MAIEVERMGRKDAIAALWRGIRYIEGSDLGMTARAGEAMEAMAYAAEFLAARPRTGKRNWYYTFGTGAGYPFRSHEFVVVHADTLEQADAKYRARFPDRDGCVNCASRYAEGEWEGVHTRCYAGRLPSLVID